MSRGRGTCPSGQTRRWVLSDWWRRQNSEPFISIEDRMGPIGIKDNICIFPGILLLGVGTELPSEGHSVFSRSTRLPQKRFYDLRLREEWVIWTQVPLQLAPGSRYLGPVGAFLSRFSISAWLPGTPIDLKSCACLQQGQFWTEWPICWCYQEGKAECNPETKGH